MMAYVSFLNTKLSHCIVFAVYARTLHLFSSIVKKINNGNENIVAYFSPVKVEDSSSSSSVSILSQKTGSEALLRFNSIFVDWDKIFFIDSCCLPHFLFPLVKICEKKYFFYVHHFSHISTLTYGNNILLVLSSLVSLCLLFIVTDFTFFSFTCTSPLWILDFGGGFDLSPSSVLSFL